MDLAFWTLSGQKAFRLCYWPKFIIAKTFNIIKLAGYLDKDVEEDKENARQRRLEFGFKNNTNSETLESDVTFPDLNEINLSKSGFSINAHFKLRILKMIHRIFR